MKCTWKDCPAESASEILGRDGKAWAHLCPKHQQEFHGAITAPDAKAILRTWVLAQGGASAATKRLLG